jgi:hypothetical protein
MSYYWWVRVTGWLKPIYSPNNQLVDIDRSTRYLLIFDSPVPCRTAEEARARALQHFYIPKGCCYKAVALSRRYGSEPKITDVFRDGSPEWLAEVAALNRHSSPKPMKTTQTEEAIA